MRQHKPVELEPFRLDGSIDQRMRPVVVSTSNGQYTWHFIPSFSSHYVLRHIPLKSTATMAPLSNLPPSRGRLTHVRFSLCYLGGQNLRLQRSPRVPLHVIAGKTRIQLFFFLDSRFRGSDGPFFGDKIVSSPATIAQDSLFPHFPSTRSRNSLLDRETGGKE